MSDDGRDMLGIDRCGQPARQRAANDIAYQAYMNLAGGGNVRFGLKKGHHLLLLEAFATKARFGRPNSESGECRRTT